MAITLRGTASAASVGGADATATLPAGTATNDVVYAAGGPRAGNTDLNIVMVTTGYTELADLFSDNGADDSANLGVFRKVQGATPDTTAIMDDSAAGNEVVLTVMVLTGVNTTTPEDATTTTATGMDAYTPDPPSITTVTAAAWVLAIGLSSEPDIPTAPTNYSDLIEEQSGKHNAMIARREIAVAGAENPGTFGNILGDTTDSWAAASVAVRPAAGGDVTMTVDAAGAVAIAGQALPLTIEIEMTTAGAVSIAGQDNLFAVVLNPVNGAVAIAGQAVLVSRDMILAPGAVAAAGQALPLTVELECETAGAVAIAGQDALFSLTCVISNGGVSIDGQTLPLTVSLGVDTSGTITVTGQDAMFVAGLIVAAGSVSIDGQVVTLSYLNPSVIRRALAIRSVGGRGSIWRGRAN